MADEDKVVPRPDGPTPEEQAAARAEAEGVIDLDKKKAARLEGKRKTPTVLFGGETFELPRELPYDLLELMSEVIDSAGFGFSRPLDDTLGALLGEENLARFKALRPAVDDVAAMMNEVLVLYGLIQGESPASSDS
jgi:hypothetical protein